jgi:hypothetical protein
MFGIGEGMSADLRGEHFQSDAFHLSPAQSIGGLMTTKAEPSHLIVSLC